MYTLENLIRGGHSLESTRNLYSQGFVPQDVFDAFYDVWVVGKIEHSGACNCGSPESQHSTLFHGLK